jgi:hypothetical protein
MNNNTEEVLEGEEYRFSMLKRHPRVQSWKVSLIINTSGAYQVPPFPHPQKKHKCIVQRIGQTTKQRIKQPQKDKTKNKQKKEYIRSLKIEIVLNWKNLKAQSFNTM